MTELPDREMARSLGALMAVVLAARQATSERRPSFQQERLERIQKEVKALRLKPQAWQVGEVVARAAIEERLQGLEAWVAVDGSTHRGPENQDR